MTKAAVLVERGKPLVLMDVVPSPLDVGQVRVKMEAAAICGRQVYEVFDMEHDDPYLPHMFGHEGCGIVLEVGPGARPKVRPGDKVVLHWRKGCGIDAYPSRWISGGMVINAGPITTFSEETIVSENRLTYIDPAFPVNYGCLLGCAITTGMGITIHDANIRPGQRVIVFGCGGIGLNVIQGAVLLGASVTAVDVRKEALELSEKFGAVESRFPGVSVPGDFDVAIDTTGEVSAMHCAITVVRPDGLVVLAGIPKRKIEIDTAELNHGKRIIGSNGGSTNPDVDIPRYVSLIWQDKIKVSDLIGGVYPFSEINKAFEAVRSGVVLGRSVLTF